MSLGAWVLIGVGVVLTAVVVGLAITGAVWNYKAKCSGTVHTHNAGEPLRPELEGSPAELISTAYERTEIAS